MVGPREMFGPVITIVPLPRPPVKSELALRAPAAEPVKFHVDRLGGLGYDFVVDESLGRLVVRLDRRPGLWVA